VITLAGQAGPVHVLRLQPGEDVRNTLEAWSRTLQLEAGSIVSAVGSLSAAHLRYAGRADGIITSGDLEVCGLSGTLARHGMHLHLTVGDRDGVMTGGHLLTGCVVRTTLEIVVQEVAGMRFLRTPDPVTTYDELDPRPLDR
jgi:predicted DNA-binding protein with PD1-like motif